MQDDSAIMMERSVMKEITDLLFHGQKRCNSGAENEQARKKQQQGNKAVHTEKGATAITALHQTAKRDERQNQIVLKKTIDSLKHKLKQVETVLTGLTTHKNKNPQLYWTADELMLQADICLFLQMFSPDCGLFTKHKNDQWRFVQEQILPVLSKSAVDAKEEEFLRRRTMLQEQQDKLERGPEAEDDDNQDEEEPEPAGRVIPDNAGGNNDDDNNTD